MREFRTGKVTVTLAPGASSAVEALVFKNAVDQNPAIRWENTTNDQGLKFMMGPTVLGRITDTGNVQMPGFVTINEGMFMVSNFLGRGGGHRITFSDNNNTMYAIELSENSGLGAGNYTGTARILGSNAGIPAFSVKSKVSQTVNLINYTDSSDVNQAGFDKVFNYYAAEQGSTPDNPPSGYRKLYPKSDGWYDLDSGGTETSLGGGGGGANTSLSNLNNPTNINRDLIGNTGGTFNVKSQDASAASQAIWISSGDSSANASGGAYIRTGTAASGFNTGVIYNTTGDIASGSGASGGIILLTGGADSGTSGDVTMQTGDSNTGDSGSMYWQIGASTASPGQFNLVGPPTQTYMNITDVSWNVTQSTPPVVTAGANAGTGASAAFSGSSSDISGEFSLTVGSSPSAGEQIKLTYNKPMPNGANVTFSPSNANASAASVKMYVDGGSDSTFFTLQASSALSAGTYTWTYAAMGRQ